MLSIHVASSVFEVLGVVVAGFVPVDVEWEAPVIFSKRSGKFGFLLFHVEFRGESKWHGESDVS